MKEKFDIKGMSCSACSLGIEKTLSKLEGVVSVTVSLMDESMLVEFEESKLSGKMICEAVNSLGYSATVFGKGEKQKNSTSDILKIRFFTSLSLLLPLMYFSMGKMLSFPLPSLTVNYCIQLVLSTAILTINYKFFTVGVRAVLHKMPNMDTLVALGASASYIFSIVTMSLYFAGKIIPEHIFYESAAMVVTLVTLGKWLEEKSKKRTGKEIEKLSKLLPNTATVIRNGKEVAVASSTLLAGDIVVYKNGDYISVDGRITEGNAAIDKSALTGESLPVDVAEGDNVASGSIVKSGYLKVCAEKTGEETLFAKIVQTVREAGASKAPIQKFADKVAGVFVPIVSAIALATFIIWIIVSKDTYTAFNFGISVLVISCPCALGLATPVAVMAATGKAALLGILYKDAEALQKSPEINCVLLDKTATITVGKPKVAELRCFMQSHEQVISLASAIETNSKHPLAECIKEYCGTSEKTCTSYRYIIGQGAIGVIDGIEYKLGNRTLATSEEQAEQLETELSNNGRTAVFLSADSKLIAVFAIADYVKEDSKEAISALNKMGISTVMVTGDNKYAAKAISEKVGLTDFIAEVLPEDKAARVTDYKGRGNKVAMVGDGINDSPALKTADLGIAIGTGTDIAIDSADIVLVNGSLKGLCDMVRLGKKAVSIIKGNLFWAFFYNVVAIPIAAGAFFTLGFSFTPSIAAACMSLSSLFVVINALRITRYKSYFETKASTLPDNHCIDLDEKEKKGENITMKKTVTIEGMMCMHCVKHVTQALENTDGIKSVIVDLGNKTAVAECDAKATDQAIKAAITAAGYEVISICTD